MVNDLHHGSPCESVFICVHPWLNFCFQGEWRRLGFLCDDVDVGTEPWKKAEDPVRNFGQAFEQERRQGGERQAVGANEIASVAGNQPESVPFENLAQVGEGGFADMASKDRVAMMVPLVQIGEIVAAEQDKNALPDVDRVGGGQDQ